MQNNVKQCRKEIKLTQEQVAKWCGVTRQTIISIESGKYVASLPLALKLARLFHRHVDEIFILEDKRNGK